MYKYLKYKKKYLDLKKLLGGAAEIDLTNSNLEINCFKLADSNLILEDLIREEELRPILGDKGDLIISNFRERNYKENIELIKKEIDNKDFNLEILKISKKIFSEETITRNDLITLYYTLSKDVLYPSEKSFLINDNILNRNSRILIEQYISKLSNIDKYFDNNIFDITRIDTHYLEKINLDRNSIVHVIGDIHGSLHSLISSIIKILDESKEAFIDRENLILKENNYLVFTGDMVDYSFYGLEVLDIILKLKIKNPNNILIIDGNHEDQQAFTRYQLGLEMKNELGEGLNIIYYLLNIFPTVIFMSLGERKYQFNHGAHPVVEKANSIKLKEFLDGDKQFYNLSNQHGFEGYDNIGRDYKWGDFNIEITKQNIPERPDVNLIQTKQYLDYIGYDAILSGHQDLCPISVLPFNGFELIEDKIHGFSLSIIGKINDDYNLLSFPAYENFYKYPLIFKSQDKNYLITFKNINRKDVLGYIPFPEQYKYKYNLSLSRINEKEPRILALIQSQACISKGKFLNYYSVSTIY